MKSLDQIERTSRGTVTVSTPRELGITPGASEAGRELYVATVGTGPTHVWLQGRIHGNEPYGTDTLLDILRTAGSNGSRNWKRIREELTLHIIRCTTPTGASSTSGTPSFRMGADRSTDGRPTQPPVVL
ncbi:MAG: M14 family zinc carboxypeptidase [Ornithinimicrobium sp.]|uniref:M14 family zinc carboxypeptidase n=1 Tax=Ornithinimicrobium sp. TaxID=1977084 RepID=UPI0026E031F2|nr:M14 family zinc carboxypeptidase [Ornithinimicrobium sp.]MDO5740989.1 M14 family zinc carboxypeptidase [Ornithinimicrobium sp.]